MKNFSDKHMKPIKFADGIEGIDGTPRDFIGLILSDIKRSTFRVIKPQPNSPDPLFARPHDDAKKFWVWIDKINPIKIMRLPKIESPYGGIGSIVFVQEPWKVISFKDNVASIEFKNGSLKEASFKETDFLMKQGVWLVPEQMPFWAARIFLEIQDVDIKKIKDISPEEAVEDGAMGRCFINGFFYRHIAIRDFVKIFESIYGDASFYLNPWVWKYTFKRI